MKYIYTTLFCLTLFMGCGGAENKNDQANYREMMLGHWEMNYTATQGSIEINIESISTYKADGSENTEGILTFSNNGVSASADYTHIAEWKIEGNTLTETITYIDIGEPRGFEEAFSGIAMLDESLKKSLNDVSIQTILELTETNITVIDEDGTENTLRKVENVRKVKNNLRQKREDAVQEKEDSEKKGNTIRFK